MKKILCKFLHHDFREVAVTHRHPKRGSHSAFAHECRRCGLREHSYPHGWWQMMLHRWCRRLPPLCGWERTDEPGE